MKKVTITLMAIGLFVLAGCGTPGPELASSAEDIVGIWHQINVPGPTGYYQYSEDGTFHGASVRERVEDQPTGKGEF